MTDLKIFKNDQFGEIRTVEENGTVLFCGSDIAGVLGYSNTRDAINRHCKPEGVVKRDGVSQTTNQYGVTTEQTVEMKFINEGNVYRLITHSKLPAAEQFEHWVFDEVFPSIRKHGLYAVDELLADPDFAIKAFTAFKEEREKCKALKLKIKEDAPKVLFANAVDAAQNSILIGDLAKMLRQNGVQTGQKRLFELLRNEGYLMKQGTSHNMPTQKAMELGLFEVKERTVKSPNGATMVACTTMVTGHGQTYFINKFLSGEGVEYN